MDKYGVLLVGAKRTHQEGHAAVFAAHPRCKLIAVASEKGDPEGRADLYQQLADEFEVPHIPDLDEALTRDDVHIVSSTPAVERRGIVATTCLNAGKHVYLDKPLAGSLDDASAIAAAAKKVEVCTQMFTQNEAKWVKAAKRAIDMGHIGTLKAIHAENLFAKGRAGSVDKAVIRQEKETVNRWTFVEAKREMFDVAVYSLAFIQALAGLDVKEVIAHTGNYFFDEHARLDVEDFGVIGMKMQGDVTATAIGGRFGWMSHPKSGPQRLVIIGTSGTLTFDPWHSRIEIYNDDRDFSVPVLDPLDPMGMWGASSSEFQPLPKHRWMGMDEGSNVMTSDVDSFINCIEEGRQPEMNAEAAALSLEVILAAYVSAARGEAVSLPLPQTTVNN